jgi:hypothetical protein
VLLAHFASSDSDLSRTFKARGDLLERARSANMLAAGGGASLLPAWRRYVGIVWKHLEPATLTTPQRKRILVPSALYGVNLATDDIGDYRLAMNASLTNVGRLGSYWRDDVTSSLMNICAGSTVVNLLTAEYVAAVDLARLATTCSVVNVTFVSAVSHKAVGHDAKAVKGLLARRLLQCGFRDLAGWSWNDWSVREVGRDIEVVCSGAGRDVT